MQFFDAVLDLTARTVGLAIDEFGGLAFVGDHKTGIVFGLAAMVVDALRFDDHAALATFPGLGGITAFAEDTRALLRLGTLTRDDHEGLGFSFQHRVFG